MSESQQSTTEERRDGGGRPVVVVGVDGSPASREALRRGLAQAASRGADLDVVMAAPAVVAVAAGVPIAVADSESVRADAERRLRAFVEDVVGGPATGEHDDTRAVAVRPRLVEGTPAQALEEAAAEADLLVVGSRGRGAVRSALLGSVALHCVTHARCPVLVVHEESSAPTGSRPMVVAGVDGSPTAPAVVAEAVREAARLGADLDVVTVFSLLDMWGDPQVLEATPAEEVAARLRIRTEELVAVTTADLAPPAPRPGKTTIKIVESSPREGRVEPVRKTTIEIVEGAPREVLVEAARGATVLVVGSSGSGVLRGVLIGSVALHCVVHAPCPVLVVSARGGVPAPRPSPAGDRATATESMTGRTA